MLWGIHRPQPITKGRFKLIGPNNESLSLMSKLKVIRNAKHTLDISYYMFKRDVVGYAVLYELYRAVQRGVDVRVLVDSMGSIHPLHGELKALYEARGVSCSIKMAN